MFSSVSLPVSRISVERALFVAPHVVEELASRTGGRPRPGRRRAGRWCRARSRRPAPRPGTGEYCGCLSSSTSRAPRSSCGLRRGVQVGAEGGERLQLAVLRQVQPQRAGDLLHRLDLRGATDAGHRDADVDGRPDTLVEQVGLQEALAVGDRDDVGRDVGRDVVGLGLDDRQAGHRAARRARRTASRSAPAAGSAGRRRRRGRPRGPAGGAAAARSRGRPRPAWTGRRRRSGRACPAYIQCWPMAEPVYGASHLKPAGVGRRRGDDGGVLHRAGVLERTAGRRRSWCPSGRSRRRCSAPAASGRRSPSSASG